MSEISPCEREIWNRCIRGKEIAILNHQVPLGHVIFSVEGWTNKAPVYRIRIDDPYLPRTGFHYMSMHKGVWRKFSMFFDRKTLSTSTIHGNDPRYPVFDQIEPAGWSNISYFFEKGFDILKKKLSFFNDMYLSSKYLPPELVARVFSFIRRCEIEKL
jgi:hypothetical protein